MRVSRRLAHTGTWAAVCASLCLAAPAAFAQQTLTEIRVSYQPSLYWAMPFIVASEKGWWAELGLKPVFSTYPAGLPQITAAASKAWDVGGVGAVPAVIGFVRHGIKTIGVTNDESMGNALMVRKEVADQFAKSPFSMRGQTIALTANSTGDYAVQSCLKKFGLRKGDVTLKGMSQADAIKEFSSGTVTLAGLWAPNIYTVQEKADARLLCSGKDAGTVVPGALVVRGEFAEQNPQLVAKFLAIYLRGWKWMNANKTEALGIMKKFYEQGGVIISDDAMKREFSTRPTLDLAGQLARMDRSGGLSDVDVWFGDMALYIRGNGAIPRFPIPLEFITDAYMRRVADDPQLRDFANNAK